MGADGAGATATSTIAARRLSPARLEDRPSIAFLRSPNVGRSDVLSCPYRVTELYYFPMEGEVRRTAAIPVFFAMIGIELFVTRKATEPRYRFADSLNNLSCGVGQQVLEPFFRPLGFFPTSSSTRTRASPRYREAPSRPGRRSPSMSIFYYVLHRASHRVNLIWASHVVHHQSEEYNLSAALRQSWLWIIVSGFFYLPLAVVGFSPDAFLVSEHAQHRLPILDSHACRRSPPALDRVAV